MNYYEAFNQLSTINYDLYIIPTNLSLSGISISTKPILIISAVVGGIVMFMGCIAGYTHFHKSQLDDEPELTMELVYRARTPPNNGVDCGAKEKGTGFIYNRAYS